MKRENIRAQGTLPTDSAAARMSAAVIDRVAAVALHKRRNTCGSRARPASPAKNEVEQQAAHLPCLVADRAILRS